MKSGHLGMTEEHFFEYLDKANVLSRAPSLLDLIFEKFAINVDTPHLSWSGFKKLYTRWSKVDPLWVLYQIDNLGFLDYLEAMFIVVCFAKHAKKTLKSFVYMVVMIAISIDNT